MAEFPKYFNPADLGKSLKEVSANFVKTPHRDLVSRWFHSSKDADFFVWADLNQNIIKQQLSFYGQVVEWNIVEGVKTGHVVVVEGGSSQNKRSEFLHFDPRPQMVPIEQALALVSCISGLHETERQKFSENFKNLAHSQTMPSEELISRFSEFLGQSKSQPVTISRWKRWMQRLSGWLKR